MNEVETHEQLTILEVRSLLRVKMRYGNEAARTAAKRMLDRLELNEPLLPPTTQPISPLLRPPHEKHLQSSDYQNR